MNKCFQALAVNTLALAAQTDTLDALEAELADSQADLLKRIQRGLPLNMAKAPRWIGEMDEISAAMSEVGLEGGARMLDGAGRTWELVAKTEVGQEPIEEARRRQRDWKSVVEIISKAAAADL